MGIIIVSPTVAMVSVGNGVCLSISYVNSYLTAINNSQICVSSLPPQYVLPSMEMVAKLLHYHSSLGPQVFIC